MKPSRAAFATIALLVAGAAAAQGPGPEMLRERTKGRADAPVTIYELADFECPACRAFWTETLPALEREYVSTGKVKLVFVNFPLAQLHPNAPAAHQFAMCAARQNRFWPVANLLYTHQAQWAPMPDPTPYFRLLADSAHLQPDSLASCVADTTIRDLIQGEEAAGMRAGVHATPSFVVEGGLVTGAAPITAWRPLLDSIYQAKTKAGTGSPR